MTDIPKRVYRTWQTELSPQTCGNLIKEIKLQCSSCNRLYDDEHRFARHGEKCLANAEHNINYQLHMHANRLIILQSRVAEFCGTSRFETVLECGLCKEEFEDEEKVRKHMRVCGNYKKEINKFMETCRPYFSNMLHSYERLGLLFQEYVTDEHIIRIQKSVTPTTIPSSSSDESITLDDVSDHFIEMTQDYMFALVNFMDDVFNRYLFKKEEDERNEKLEIIRREFKRHSKSCSDGSEDSDEEEDEEDDMDSESSSESEEEDVDEDGEEGDDEMEEDVDADDLEMYLSDYEDNFEEEMEDSPSDEEYQDYAENDEIMSEDDDEMMVEDDEYPEDVEYIMEVPFVAVQVESDVDEDEIIDVVM